jgi:RNA polymerase sigma-70 factor, ECF subfamily
LRVLTQFGASWWSRVSAGFHPRLGILDIDSRTSSPNAPSLAAISRQTFACGAAYYPGMTAIPLNLAGGFLGLGGRSLRGRSAGVKPSGDASGRTTPADIIAKRRASTARGAAGVLALTDRSDESLLAAYQQGDREAFTTLMGRYANELLHFLTRFLGSRAAADDVFQETFLQVHLSADTFDVERRFKPWLFTIAANKARDYYRKHNRNAAASLSASIDGEDGDRFVDLLEAEGPAPHSPLLDAERSRLVKHVIDAMPAHLREILLLSYFQRLSYNQIADTLEIPLGTVKSRLHTAVAAFAKAWKAARGERRNTNDSGETPEMRRMDDTDQGSMT